MIWGCQLHESGLNNATHFVTNQFLCVDCSVLYMVLKGEITLRGEMFGALGLSIATDHFYDLPVYIDKGLFSLGVRVITHSLRVFTFFVQSSLFLHHPSPP